jgi:polyhydroxyalkanoate synthesis regulator phasin
VPRRNLDELVGFNADLDDLTTGSGLDAFFVHESNEIVVGTDTELSTDESLELERCEAIIERGLKTFYEVGTALLRVRDLKLYRMEYSTFEAYCAERWSIARRTAYQLMDAAHVTENVRNCAQTAPLNEAQARPLTRLKDPEQQRKAWQQAVATAAGRVTAAHVEQVVKEMLARSAPVEERDTAHTPAHQEVVIDQDEEAHPVAAGAPAPVEEIISDQSYTDTRSPVESVALREEIAALRQQITDAQAIIEEYQEHIIRAQNYNPTSDRGEMVSTLLRLVERVYVRLKDER